MQCPRAVAVRLMQFFLPNGPRLQGGRKIGQIIGDLRVVRDVQRQGQTQKRAVKIMPRQFFARRDHLAHTPHGAHQELQAERAGHRPGQTGC